MNIFRRLPLSRLLVVLGAMLAAGISATALASALGSSPKPAPKSLAEAVHGALTAPPVQGFSANIKLTDHLLEGANLAGGGGGEAGQLAASPLISGASGRLWIAGDGRVRLELQAEKGDTQIYYDGNTVSMYDAATNTLYRYRPAKGSADPAAPSAPYPAHPHAAPSVAKIEQQIAKLHGATLTGATPTDVAGRPAYTARIAPREGGSLIGGAELSWDAETGTPLRAAVYSSTSSSPVIELAATESVSYGPVDASVFEFTPPASAKVQDVKLPEGRPKGTAASRAGAARRHAKAAGHAAGAKVTHKGHGIASVLVVEDKASAKGGAALPESLPKVKINGVMASELPTAVGTILSFERSGIRYLVAGFVTPAALETVARGL